MRPAARPSAPSRAVARWLVAPLALVAALGLPVAAGDDDPEDRAADAGRRLDGAVDDHDHDAIAEAVRTIDGLWDQLDERTRGRLAKRLAAILEMQPKRSGGGDFDPRYDLLPSYQMAIGVLFDKPEGPPLLRDALRERHIERWPDATGLLLEALGHGADPEDVDLFVDHLENESPTVVIAAAGALSRLDEADRAVRLRAVEGLVEVWEDLTAAAEKEARRDREEEARDRLGMVEGALASALESLTRRRLSDPAAWREWLDEHGSEEGW